MKRDFLTCLWISLTLWLLAVAIFQAEIIRSNDRVIEILLRIEERRK